MTDISELEAALARAIVERDQKDDAAWDADHARVLDLERQLFAAKGEPYAIPVDFPVQWDVGAPSPHLFANDWNVFLIFLVSVDEPTQDAPCAVVEFHFPQLVRFGSPNEDIHSGHYLYGKGQEPYTAQIVENSTWLHETNLMNQAHSNYDSERWQRIHHYIFWFHDITFECLARSFEVTTYHEDMGVVIEKIVRLLKRG
jgi:hypothetical protein